MNLYYSIFLVIISIIIYCIWNIEVSIPKELQGWVMITFLTPVFNMFLNSKTIITTFKNCICYSHTWKSEDSNNIIDWINNYCLKNCIWKQETYTKINDKNQKMEYPIEWCIIKYNNKLLWVYLACPKKEDGLFSQTISIYSLLKIDWNLFLQSLENSFNEFTENKLITHEYYHKYSLKWNSSIKNINNSIDKSWCFGNPEKEKCWDILEKFLSNDTKVLYDKLNQQHKCSFLISGKPGTGKSNFLYLFANYYVKFENKPIYYLDPQKLDNMDFFKVITKIENAFILVDEFDKKIKLTKEDYPDLTEDERKQLSYSVNLYPTIASWQNILDNCSNNIIWWFTTNNREHLEKINHGSLIRKGRIDYEFNFDDNSQKEKELILHKFAPDINIDKLDDDMTIAEIMNFIKDHKMKEILSN